MMYALIDKKSKCILSYHDFNSCTVCRFDSVTNFVSCACCQGTKSHSLAVYFPFAFDYNLCFVNIETGNERYVLMPSLIR